MRLAAVYTQFDLYPGTIVIAGPIDSISFTLRYTTCRQKMRQERRNPKQLRLTSSDRRKAQTTS